MPGTGEVPNTMRPGGAPPPSNPIQDRIQRDAQADALWANMAAPSSVSGILAANAAANQQAASHAAMGYGASGLRYTQAASVPNMGNFGSTTGGANPLGQYATPQMGSALWFLSNITRTTQQTAANTSGLVGAVNTGIGGGGQGIPPPGGGPNVPNFSWSPGGRPPPIVPNFGGGAGAPPGGGSGGMLPPGGGGSGSPGGGGFGGGGLAGQIGAWVGLRNTGTALSGGLSMAVGAEMARELFFLPQTIAGIESKWLGNTAQARSFIGSTSILGQSGGFNSRDFRANLHRAAERGGDDWLLRSGLGADEAAEMVANLGVVPRSVEQATAVARNMASSRITPGMSGIPTGMLTGIMRDMLGIGAVSLDRTGSMNNDLGAIMKQTAQTGQDQLRVLRSIDTGVVNLSTAPGAVAAIGPDTLFQANQRYITTPAGMAGTAGAESITATQSAFSTVGSNPARTIVASSLVEKLQSEKDLSEYFGRDNWEKFTSSPIGRELADKYLRDIKAGNKLGAMYTFSQGLLQDPTLASSASAQGAFINNAVTNQYGPGQEGLRLAAQANLSNRSEADVVAYNLAQRRGVALGTAANNPLNLSDAGQPGVIGSVTAADKQKVAVFPNMAAGIAASVNQLREYEKNGLMSPRELAMKWSGGHASEAYVKSVADSMGVSADTKVNMNDPEMARRYIQGAQPFETGPSRLSRADINAGVDLAFGRQSANPNLRTDGSPDPNVPEYFPAVGRAKSDVLGMGSELTLRQGENLYERVNQASDAWQAIVWAAEALATTIRAAAAAQGATPLSTVH